MSGDSNPLFTAEFFSNIKILSQDLFQSSATAPQHTTKFSSLLKNDVPRKTPTNWDSASVNSISPFSASNPKKSRRARSFNEHGRGSGLNLGGRVSERDREGEWWANSANKDGKSSSKDTIRGKDIEKDTDKDKDKDKEREKEKDKDYFSIESIHDRLRVYAREGGVPLELVDRYSEHRKMKMTPFQEFQEQNN
jgi:hypothetical protein